MCALLVKCYMKRCQALRLDSMYHFCGPVISDDPRVAFFRRIRTLSGPGDGGMRGVRASTSPPLGSSNPTFVSTESQPTMGYSTHRLSKVVRTTCAPFTAVLGFSVLLTIVFVLYQPTRGPGDLQKLGWQSWATVSSKSATNGKVATDNTTTQDGDKTNSVPPGTDWWDVESPEPEVESSSLPLDVWDPLMPHDTGCMCTVLCRSQFCSCFTPQWPKLRLRSATSTPNSFVGCASRKRSLKTMPSRESGFALGRT